MFLLAVRNSMIFWITLTLMPVEIVFDAIETELERRGVPL